MLIASLLGLFQGITEFFPVSSSGHLQIAKELFGIEGLGIGFSLATHLGTAAAILCLFWRDLPLCFRKFPLFLLGTLPLCLVPLFRTQIDWVYAHPGALAPCFFLTALVLYLGERFGHVLERKRRKREGVFIGILQLVAILPGVSRSGSTISGARLVGWEMEEAVRFSFLLALPAILGGAALELPHIQESTLPASTYFIGFLTSFVSGIIGAKLFLKLIEKRKLMPFVWYCAALGLFTLFAL